MQVREQQLELDMEQQTGSKQEMERMNTDILGISDLKWTGMDEFNSDGQILEFQLQHQSFQ